MQEKICNICNISKTLDNYHFSKVCKYGVRNTCKDCRKIKEKEYKSRPDVKVLAQKYYQDNKEAFRERMSIHYHSLNGQYHQYKKRAKKSNYIFELTEDDCRMFYKTKCNYCGNDIKGLGIDRIDNDKGYILENCVSCCSTCNYMKHVQNFDNFKKQIIKIAKHLNLEI